MFGNGGLDLIAPRERYLMWQVGPEGMRKAALWLAEHPTATRLRGIVRIGIDLWLAQKQYEELEREPVEELGPWYKRWCKDAILRGGFDNDEIWGGPGKDLIDCAYVASRDKGEAYDIAHAVLGEDTVVDCKTVVHDDTSQ